jgi:hypothetical protein
MKKYQILMLVEAIKPRSAWEHGVKEYEKELLDTVPCDHSFGDCDADMRLLLNGAEDWLQYSEGACSLVYNRDIAERLCNPSELRRTDHGRLAPNSRETWIDVQARALRQAARNILQRVAENT